MLKLLWVGDAGTLTGFARVTHGVLDRLHATGDYDISVMAINYNGDPHDKPYKLYPASMDMNPAGDWIGAGRLQHMLQGTEFDSIVLFQDIWNIAQYLMILDPSKLNGLVTYYPLDAPSLKPTWTLFLARSVVNATYTSFAAEETAVSAKSAFETVTRGAKMSGKDELDVFGITHEATTYPFSAYRLKQLTRTKGTNVIPHGTDLETFHEADPILSKAIFGFNPDDFVVTNIARNQPRKRLDLTIRGFAKFAENKPNARLAIHSFGSQDGWDLTYLSHYYGCADKMHLIHNEMTHDLTDEQLNYLYNASDVVINTSAGEGWGLPQFEAAAAKRPLIVPDWSATGLLWKDAAMLTPIESTYHTVRINTLACQIDDNAFAEQLTELYESPELREELGQKAYEVVSKDEYNWDNIAKQFDGFIKQAADEGAPKNKKVSI